MTNDEEEEIKYRLVIHRGTSIGLRVAICAIESIHGHDGSTSGAVSVMTMTICLLLWKLQQKDDGQEYRDPCPTNEKYISQHEVSKVPLGACILAP